MKKNNLKKLTLKEKIQRVDFIFIILFGLFLCFLLYTNQPHDSRARVGARMLLFLIPIMTVVLSNLRYKFVYGTEEYRKKIRGNYKNSSKSWALPKKELVNVMIWSGSAIVIILNFAQEKYFYCFLVILFAAFSSYILSKKINKHLELQRLSGIKIDNVKKYSSWYTLPLVLIILILVMVLFSSLAKGQFLISGLILICVVFFVSVFFIN